MPEFVGRLEPVARVAVVVSQYHERITSRLLEGATATCLEAGMPPDNIDVLWVTGAFELGVVSTAAAHSGRYDAIVALGAVIRGDTPHFEFVAREAASALGRAASDSLVPVGFGLLTCDTMDQAEARAGGAAGNKGRDAAEAALRTANLIRQALEE
ncbi:MAG TPA: 6,7-dimethyl-8-ribityllumazine synthase [Gemmatimonadales bacterium]|jgi:6,7-dimethyl-8-ribityllumazine synthase